MPECERVLIFKSVGGATSMTTGILCATPEELDALHHRFEFDGSRPRLLGFSSGRGMSRTAPDLSSCPSLVLEVSMPPTPATILFTTFGCDLIFSGVAGALTDLEVGSVVLVTKGATHDDGLVSNGVFTCVPVGDLPLPGIAQPLQGSATRSIAGLSKRWSISGDRTADKLTIRLGSVLSGDVFID